MAAEHRYTPNGLYPLMEKASGVNLEAKSGAGVSKAVHVVLPTPAMSLEPVVLALAFPLDHFSNVKRGGSAAWVAAYPPYYFTQASCSGEDTPRFRTCYHSLLRLKDAYETTLMAESEEELKNLLMRVKEESEKNGLKLNKKTKIMVPSPPGK